jgi:serine/threonine protein kinase
MSAKISDLGVAKILNLNPARMTQLTTCPGTPSYMPPEALVERPIYSTNMDNFAYGNLMVHVFCGRWPVPGEAFRADPRDPNVMMPCTEVQRRDEYLKDIGEAHPLMGTMRQCLSNNPTARPNVF